MAYAGTSRYDDFGLAAGSGYITQLAIEVGGVYALWLSNSPYWTPHDHFCKARIISIEDVGSSLKVTFQVAYQKIGGLRWLKTN